MGVINFVIILLIVALIIYLIEGDSEFSFSTHKKDQFQATLRPISGPGLYTKYYDLENPFRVREISRIYCPPVQQKAGNPLWWNAPGWGLSRTWGGTLYRDAQFQKQCMKEYPNCCGIQKCDTRVPNYMYRRWLNGM